jgi:predicted phage terminase large subunit-like protein
MITKENIGSMISPIDPVTSMMHLTADKLDPDVYLDEEELGMVTLAREKMRYFIPYTFSDYKTDVFHLHVCDYVDRVVYADHPDGHISHLMLFAPPQTGKSEIVSTRLPGFWLAHNHDLPVLLASYGDDLAKRNSINAREVVQHPAYERLFSSQGILPDVKRWKQKDWHLFGYKGHVWAAGMGGRVTGEGFGLIIIDDPVKDWAEAQSDTVRENLWQWWRGTLKTRLWENGCMVFMMTRWHEDDLAARVLREEGNLNLCKDCDFYMADDNDPVLCPECGGGRGKWKVLSYAALSETQEERDIANKLIGLPEGLPDALGREPDRSAAPSRFSDKHYKEMRDEVGPLVWDAEYQQHPTPPKGDFFKVGRIEIEDMYPVDVFGGDIEAFESSGIPVGLKNCIRFWDLAATEEERSKADPDWTVGALVGRDEETGLTWVLNVVRVRGESQTVEDMIKQTAKLDGKKVPIRIEQEGGASGKSLINIYTRILAGYDCEGRPSTGGKDVRARGFSSQVNAGNVRLLEGKWNQPWMAVHRAFPHGKHDDDVDATSGAFNEVAGEEDRYRQKFKHL